jgi:PrtD family type I secretion system ABC transporter
MQPQSMTGLHKALQACRVVYVYALMFGVMINLLMLASPIYSMQVLDRVLSSFHKETLLMLTLVIVFALVCLSLLQLGRAFVMQRMGAWLDAQLSPILFSYTVRNAAEKRTAGGSQAMRDLNTLRGFLTSPSFVTMLDTPWSIIFLIVLFILHPWLGWLAVMGGVLLVGLTYMNEKATKPLLDRSNEHYLKSMQLTEQANRNAEVITVMGLLPAVMKQWLSANNMFFSLQRTANSRAAILGETTKCIRMILQIAVTGVGAYLVIKHELSSGAIIASSTLVSRALSPFEAAIGSWKNCVAARKAYINLETLFKQYADDGEKISLPEPSGLLQVENVFYAPAPNQKPIVKSVGFELNPGEVLAVIGASASGKTTLAKLLVGAVRPSIGNVRLDGADMYSWSSEDKGKYIGYVPQNIELFSGTIKANIARMDPDAPSDAIIAAAKLAGVHDMILRLPQGYETDIGLEGSMLSGGQRQRLALARAFYGSPRFVVLDEPNSNLDSQGEAALADAISAAKARKVTTIVISHRTSLMSIVDKILIMKEGMAAAFGPRDQILAQLNGLPTPGAAAPALPSNADASRQTTGAATPRMPRAPSTGPKVTFMHKGATKNQTDLEDNVKAKADKPGKPVANSDNP